MLFNSAEYLFLFLPLCLLLYYYLKSTTAKTLGLIVLSMYFYMVAYPAYIGVLLGLIGADYGFARLIDRSKTPWRKIWLWVALGSNVALLAAFKYLNFFADNLIYLGIELPKHSWMLPVGLSFHTFQSMSYLVEVYRKSFPVEKNLGRYSLYVLFFPQMVAGPIERPQNILPQLKFLPGFDLQNLKQGLFLLASGLFMKVAVADRLTLLVDPVFKEPENAGSVQSLLAVLFFGIQIYADFSGYSRMALGAAKMLGIDLMVNFRQPYLADSLGEFWRRWHISLSTWFRDYVYFPLGGSREGSFRTVRNILIIFALSGLWHGAGWNYILWGLLHGIGLSLETLIGKFIPWKTPALVRILRTQAWVLFCWVFFRASSLANGLDVLKGIFSPSGNGLGLEISPPEIGYGLGISLLILVSEYFNFQERAFQRIGWFFTLLLFVLAYFLGNFNATTFIYFQF
jgi:alginate O-acetyltransferase complex protein AlgI